MLTNQRGDPVVIEFDFRVDGDQLRGKGWRGLIALGIILTARRGVLIAILALLAKPLSVWSVQLSQLLQQLMGS